MESNRLPFQSVDWQPRKRLRAPNAVSVLEGRRGVAGCRGRTCPWAPLAAGSAHGAWVSGSVEFREIVVLDGGRTGRSARGQARAAEVGVGGFDDAEDQHAVAASTAVLRIDVEDTLEQL